MARIAIDPELWRKVRVRAFEEGTTGAEVINKAVRHFLDTKAPTAKATKARTESSDGAPHSAQPPKEDPWTKLPTVATPEEAAARAAEIASSRGREIRPVPKPTSRRTRSRSKPASSTDDLDD